MRNRRLISLLSCLVIASIFTGCFKQEVTNNSQSNSFAVSQVAVSSKSVTISWPKNTGNSSDYKIRVYNDVGLSNVVNEFRYSADSSKEHRFTVPFLDSASSYYIVVVDSDGNRSIPYEVLLEDNITRRIILVQDFDKLCWGYDYINSACGIRLDSETEKNIGYYSPTTLAESIEKCHTAERVGDEGGQLLYGNQNLKRLLGVTGWDGTKGSIYIRPGYVKLGKASSETTTLKSPNFSATIGEGEKVSTTLSFDVCMYTPSASNDSGEITASIVKGDGSKLWSKSIFIEAVTATPKWQHYEFNIDKVSSDCHFEITTNDKVRQVCFDNLKIIQKIEIPNNHVYGYIIDKDTNNAIEGVAVSDGFQVVVTDKEGFYHMEPHKDSYYIFYSLPAEYKITVGGNGLPKFFTRRTSDVREYNFSLRKMEGGIEKKFALFGLGDPQVSSETKLNRFKKQAVPGIAEYAKSLDMPCYGITLGDIISNSSGSNSEAFREKMRSAMNYKHIGMPVYQVMGNHDANYYDADSPVEADSHSSTYNIKAQRTFESVYGPINYSFNRGNVHIVGMRDIVYNSQTSMADYDPGFLDSQYEWLKQDLAVVPKTKTVVLCVHIQLHGHRTSKINHTGDVHKLLNEFQEAHIISGHTHINRNEEPSSGINIYEHNVGTVCGTWWASNVCGDGTPNGFSVFVGGDTGFSEWYYMGYNEGMNKRDYQMRLYRGNAITGAKIDDNKNGVEGYYSFNFGENVILANVFNADSKWKISVYEDDEYSGDMKKITDTSATYKSELVGSYTFEDPRRIKDKVEAANDMWVVGFHMGVLDKFSTKENKPSNGSWSANTHMYKYKLKNKNAKVKVVATDRFGNRYESDKFVDYRDNNLARKP